MPDLPHTERARRLCIAWVAASFLVACGPGEGTLIVQVRTDLLPGRELVEVRTTLADRVTITPADEARDWGAGVRVAEIAVEAGVHRVTVAAHGRDGSLLVSRRVRVDVEGVRVVTVLLARDCQGIECPQDGDDPAAMACLGGRCVLEGCEEERPDECASPQCSSETDCPASPDACGSVECSPSGSCFVAPMHELCPGDAICDPAVGCVPADVRAIPFGAPTRIEELSHDLLDDEDVTLSADGLEIFFTRVQDDRDIWTSTRDSLADPWLPPVRVSDVDTPGHEDNASLSRDGRTLYFVRGSRISSSTRAGPGSPWSPGELLSIPLTDVAFSPGPSADHLEFAYATFSLVGDLDIGIMTRPNEMSSFDAPTFVDSLSDPGVDASAFLRVPGGRVLYFSSDRAGSRDLYFATRPSRADPFGPPIAIAELNTPGADEDPWLSDDERTIIFSTIGPSGTKDLFTATR